MPELPAPHTDPCRQVAYERERLHAVLDAVGTAVLVIDRAGIVNAANPEAVRLIGPSSSLLGASFPTLLRVGTNEETSHPLMSREGLASVFLQHRWHVNDICLRSVDRQPFPADCVIVPFATDGASAEEVNGAVVVITDNSTRDAALAQLEWQATHDPLTGLSNRNVLVDRLEHALVLAERSSSWPSVMFIDLDHFKAVNDQFGHGTGDRLLVEAARRIVDATRTVDTVARVGGDEFVVLCEALERPDVAELVAARILRSLEEPFAFDEELVRISASVGIARADETNQSADQIVRNADLAMYQAKETGRNCMKIFDDAMLSKTRRRIDLERALRVAIDNDELNVAYQPIFSLADDSLFAFEALARWHDVDFGNVEPIEFIAIAEETGLITAVAERVLDVACRDAASWSTAAGRPIRLHVNVSSRQLGASTFANYLARVLKHHHVDPTMITLELTESMLLDNPERQNDRFHALRDLGVRIAVDDFGTVYSSLAYLRRYPIDVVKLDRQFVAGIWQTERGRHILQAILDLAAGLNYSVIAEGVEHEDELDALRALGCEYAQGHFLGGPMPPAEALLLTASVLHTFPVEPGYPNRMNRAHTS